MTRELINRLIEKERFQGMVMGANPAWFHDDEKVKYFWSLGIFDDGNDIISTLESPIEYTGLDSLIGLRLGCIRGHYYVGISPLMDKGLLYRDDVNSATQNLRKVTSGRVNAAIINRSFLQYYLINNPQNFYISKQPHAIHTKQILFTREFEPHYLIVNEILNNARLNGDLNKLISAYR